MNIKKTKVLFFLPGGVGGGERMTITVARLLPTDRFEVKFVVIGRLRSIYDFIPEGYSVDCIPVHNIYEFSTIRILWKILQESPDLVYCSQAAYNPRVIIASKIAHVPIIARSTGMVSTYSKSSFRNVKATYKYADRVIAQQEDMRQEIITLLGVKSDKVITLHNPLDTSNIDKKALAESPYPKSNQVNFCNVSRISRDKAHDIAIPAFAEVVKNIPNAHLYFVGNYNVKDAYYKILFTDASRLGIADHIHFVGYTDNPYRWMKNCDCFVFPSRREGLPNALIEASYLERPCVAAKCLNIVSDIIVDGVNGYTVPVGDVDALADAMKNAIKLTTCKMQYRPSQSSDFVSVFTNLLKSI